MAKKKAFDMQAELNRLDEQLCKATTFSDGIKKIERIPTGIPEFDRASGGGLPRGRIVEIFAPENVGKTSKAYKALSVIQEKFLNAKENDLPTLDAANPKAPGRGAFVDFETKHDAFYAENTYNLVHPEYIKIKGKKKKVLEDNGFRFYQPDTAEEGTNKMEQLVKSHAFDLIVGDSAAAILPKEEEENAVGKQHYALQARIMSQHCRKISGPVGKSRCCVVWLNQARLVQQKGSNYVYWDSPGAKAFRHFAAMRIFMNKLRNLKEKGETVGHVIRVVIKKDQVGPCLGKEVEIPFYYGEGFCPYTLIIEDAISFDLIEKASNGWFSYKEKTIGQGMRAVREWCANYPTTFNKLRDQVEALKKEEDDDADQEDEVSELSESQDDDIDLDW